MGYRVLNDTRKERTVRMTGVDMPPFFGKGYCVGENGKSSCINVTEPEEYKKRMVEQMGHVEATSKHFRVFSRERNSFQGLSHELGGRPLHNGVDLTNSKTNVSFSSLVDPAFSPTSSDEMIVSRAKEASPCRLPVLVFKKMTEEEIAEEETQTDEAAPKLQDFWPYTGSKDVVGGRGEDELRAAYNADRGTENPKDDGRFYFVWGKIKRDKEAGEITVALRHGFGVFVECVPPIEACEILPSRYGRKRRQTQLFNPAARAKEETRGTGAKIESISARLNGGLFRVTALMTEEQLRECEAGELIEKFNRVLKVGRYRKLSWSLAKTKQR
jgi:hypothetical protein